MLNLQVLKYVCSCWEK